jgi:hypothetical protein
MDAAFVSFSCGAAELIMTGSERLGCHSWYYCVSKALV